jgi:hypothetical protein
MPPLFEPDTHRFGGSCHVYTCEAREQSQRRQALTGVFIHTDRLVLTGLDGLRRSLVRPTFANSEHALQKIGSDGTVPFSTLF